MTDTLLGTYNGRDVIGAAMALTNAGDGLSAAMKLAPVELHMGDRVLVLVEAVVVSEKHVPAIKGDLDGPYAFVSVLKAQAAKITTLAGAVREMDKHKGQLDKLTQIEGQQSILDDGADGGSE